MGFSGLLVPEEFGGSGLGCVEAGVVMEEIGRTLMPSPFLSTAVLAASALSRGGSAAQKSEHLPKIADGSLLAALAVDEGAKHRPLQTEHAGGALRQRLQAQRRQGLCGRRPCRRSLDRRGAHRGRCRRARRADAVSGRSQEPRASRPSAPPWSMPTTRRGSTSTMSRSMPTACSAKSIRAIALLEGVLNIGRGAVASEMVGLSEEVFGRTVELSQGAQAVRQGDRRIPGAAAPRRAALYRHRDHPRRGAEGAADAGWRFRQAAAAVAVAKARAGTTATLAVQEGVQMHGGMGMTDQFDIGFFMKRARVCQELFGDTNFHADQLARMKSY